MNDDTLDILTAWWSPAGWLRLVWSAWVDPLWYWLHVRPRLGDRRTQALTSLQATLGALIVTLAIAALVGGVAAAAGAAVDWRDLFLSGMRGLFLVVAISLFGGGAPLIAICGVAFGAALSIAAGTVQEEISPLMLGTLLAIVVALSGGVFAGVHRGMRFGVGGALFAAAILGLVLLVQAGWVAGLVGTILMAAGIYLGSHWATRQVADDKTREELARANPPQAGRPPRVKR
ncbi:MAG: hypothetical protein JXA93_17310 [Anaerolineae bacterium]|nr:hypothetical protein [Anaerolineae bacterium]